MLPRTEFVYEALFDLEPMMNLGEGPLAERRIVPIVGGVFAGPRIKGKVCPEARTGSSCARTARAC